MKYNFDKVINRRNSDSLKWNVEEAVLPMWVADMDFQAAPEIISAIKNKAEQGVFGYSVVTQEWYDAIAGWWKKRHGLEIEKNRLIFCTGVVPAISSIVRKMTTVGEDILVLTPVYNIFFNSIVNNGRRVLECPLSYDKETYSINFTDLEEKLARPQTTMMILCNPHNPIGKVWDKETLELIGKLCFKHNVIVVSDEIHCDLTNPNCNYTPFASVSKKCRQNSITCIAPTKAFNLAGLQTAAALVPNELLYHKVSRAFNTDEIAEPNSFAVAAATAAFTKGEPWLDELREYLKGNKDIVKEYLERNNLQIKAVSSEATYLVWLDCKALAGCTSEFSHFLRESGGLYLSNGISYGGNGKYFLRMNIACPREVLKEGLERLKNGIKAYEAMADSLC